MSKFAVFLNGPPNCGKDFLGKVLNERNEGKSQLAAFKTHLNKVTAEYYNIPLMTFEKYANERKTKELPLKRLGGLSTRKAQQFVSEEIYKPRQGKDFFGKVLARNLKEGVTFITDSGFVEEAQAVVDEIGEENCLLVHIYAPNTSFEGDTRSYIDLEGVCAIDVVNDKDRPDVLERTLDRIESHVCQIAAMNRIRNIKEKLINE